MNGVPWKRYVASICREAWSLDDRATDEVMRCVEDMIAATGVADASSVQVFLSVDAGEPRAGQSSTTVRIRLCV